MNFIPSSRLQLLSLITTAIALLLLLTFSVYSLSASHRFFHRPLDRPPDPPAKRPSNVAILDSTTLPLNLTSNELSPNITWLIGTMVPYFSLTRREIIRSTWQTLYADPDLYIPRFIVSRIPEPWRAVIAAENATHGDIWELDFLEENAHVANTVKSIEFFKYLLRSYGDPLPWQFVSKIDDDSYLDVPRFRAQYLLPLLASQKNLTRTIIGRNCHIGDTTFAGGQFYTLTRDMLPLLKRLHDKHPINYHGEDYMNAKLLQEVGEKWTLMDLPNRVAYDYKDPKKRKQKRDKGKDEEKKEENLVDANWDSVCAGDGDDVGAWVHPVNKGSVNPHKMKQDADYLRVAAAFDDKGCRCGREE